MRILLTNSSLAARTGSELYVLDVARELLRGGHQPICYSPILGEVAKELHQETIAVTDQLANIQLVPDVIHGQHHMETLAALMHFPGVPAIQYCHGWLPWQEAPIDFPRVRHYVAVDRVGWERLTTRHGIPESRIATIPNFFDDSRFPQRKKPLPPKPTRSLVFSNAFEAQAVPIRKACRHFGISVDVIGIGAGNIHTKPELLLPDYHIVFARGRAALEAMACGAAVICCGLEGSGPLITSANIDSLSDINFGIRTSTGPCDASALSAQIELYDRLDAEKVSARVRAEATVGGTVARLLEIYADAISSNDRQPSTVADEAQAVSRYLRQWSPPFREWAEKSLQNERLAPENRHLQYLAQQLESELADARLQVAAAQRDTTKLQQEIDQIHDSLTWRIPLAIMNWKPFGTTLSRISNRFRKKPPPPTSEEHAPHTTNDELRRVEVRS